MVKCTQSLKANIQGIYSSQAIKYGLSDSTYYNSKYCILQKTIKNSSTFLNIIYDKLLLAHHISSYI